MFIQLYYVKNAAVIGGHAWEMSMVCASAQLEKVISISLL